MEPIMPVTPPSPQPGPNQPGRIVLFGSGETAAAGGKIYDYLAPTLPATPHLVVLETPAGFQPNSAAVAGKVADYLATRLQALHPRLTIVPARRRESPTSPDDPAVTAPIETADLLFLGPGSPTYAARQLRDSLAWQRLQARHAAGATVILASAATIAAGRFVLPVYEIYKAGLDLHWCPGLDLLGHYGLGAVLVPHWNNAEGGAGLDTTRCFMGSQRFAELVTLLPEPLPIIGIDEHTALVIDPPTGTGQVFGRGSVTLQLPTTTRTVRAGDTIDLRELGPFRCPTHASAGGESPTAQPPPAQPSPTAPPPGILQLVEDRQLARARGDWATADVLRHQVTSAGWSIRDTPAGPEVVPLPG